MDLEAPLSNRPECSQFFAFGEPSKCLFIFQQSAFVWRDTIYHLKCIHASESEKAAIRSCKGAVTMRIPTTAALLLTLAGLTFSARAQYVQQGNKFFGIGAAGAAEQGYSVAISADGSTALVGGAFDDNITGATWVFTQSGGVWTQQGNKLVGSGSVGDASQGASVALSADGNTALIGGRVDNNGVGAAWVFTRNGGVWTQQGGKLVGSGAIGQAVQGVSVSLSGDGNTALIGGYNDNQGEGAAWVFTQSGGVWTQLGNKLVGTGNNGFANQGVSVALSQDGLTALIGGNGDSAAIGAAWVFTLSGGVWTQQGGKLVGTGFVINAAQGASVSLSSDGNTALIGGPQDNSAAGAVWVFTRSGGVWTQQGNKLVGTGAAGPAHQGCLVSLSGDGTTALIGGYADNSNLGAAWVFTQSGGVWTQQGVKLVGTGNTGSSLQGYGVALSTDGSTALIGGPSDNLQSGAAWAFAAGLVISFANDQNPSLLNQTVNFSISATDSDATTVNYTLDFGDGSTMATGTFTQGTTVVLPHAYTQYSDAGLTAKLTLSDGTNQATRTILQTIPSPASGAVGVTNIAQGAAPIEAPLATPLGGVSVAVGSSDGGVIQLAINVDALTRSAYSVSTDFGDFQGRSSKNIVGLTPVHKYLQHGLFVAHTTATNLATRKVAGEARITLPVSAKETGEPAVTGQNRALKIPTPPIVTSVLTTKSLKGKFAFNGVKPDTVSYSGTVTLQTGFDPSKSHELWFGIGNILVVTTVSNKGVGKVPGTPAVLKSLKFSTKVKKGKIAVGGELATVTITYSTAAMVANGFNTEGISAQSTDFVKNKSVRTIQVAMLIDGVPYQVLAAVNFSLSGGSDFGNISGRSSK